MTGGLIYNVSKCNCVKINIRDILNKYLEMTGMSPAEFARKSGLEKQTIYNYIKEGSNVYPNQRTLDSIFEAHPEFRKIYENVIGISTTSERVLIYSTEYDKAIRDLRLEIKELQDAIAKKEHIIKLLTKSKMRENE